MGLVCLTDYFHDRSHQLMHLADLFSLLASYLHRTHAGFPSLVRGALPTSNLTTESQRASHRLMLFFQALLYALIRSLTRRVRNLSGRSREAKEYSQVLGVEPGRLNESQEMDEELRWELGMLKKALLRCDPLHAHPHRGKEGQPACSCFSRSHASWYLICWHFLTVRYRRFLSPEDIDHIAFRSIEFSVPSFPAEASLQGGDAGSTDNAGNGLGAFAWSFHLPGFLGPASSSTSAAPATLPGPHGPPLLNPDSLLFSLTASPTSQQTKEWFGLSEFALPATAARMWAGWLGYGWGEGGAYWEEGGRREAEARLGVMRGDASGGGQKALPVERVLMAHARWRARALLTQREVLLPSASLVPDQIEKQQDGMDSKAVAQRRSALLSRSAAFDFHFLSRCLQIQTWALRGWGSRPGLTSDAVNDRTTVPPGMGAEKAPVRGSVARSSPFATFLAPDGQGAGVVSSAPRRSLWRSINAFLAAWLPHKHREAMLARYERQEAREQQLLSARRWQQAWVSVQEPLLSFMTEEGDVSPPKDEGDGSADDELTSAVKTALKQERRTLQLLGDLHHGLSPHREKSSTVTMCNEDPTIESPPENDTSANKDGEERSTQRGQLHTWLGTTPPSRSCNRNLSSRLVPTLSLESSAVVLLFAISLFVLIASIVLFRRMQ